MQQHAISSLFVLIVLEGEPVDYLVLYLFFYETFVIVTIKKITRSDGQGV